MLVGLYDHINVQSAKHWELVEIDNSPLSHFRSVQIKQRSDLICVEADLEISIYSAESIQFEMKYYTELSLRHRMFPQKKMYTPEMVADLRDLLVLALRYTERIGELRDETQRLVRDFSTETFKIMRFRLWILHIHAKRLVRLMGSEFRKGQRAAKKTDNLEEAIKMTRERDVHSGEELAKMLRSPPEDPNGFLSNPANLMLT